MTTRILFVCMGNICRSPLAEGLMRHHAETIGLKVEIDSAGTGSWHIGDPPDARAIVAARGRGIEISAQRARVARPGDFTDFSLIIAMDRSTVDELEIVRPFGNETPIKLLSDFYEGDPIDVPDPYYSGKFEPVLELIEKALPQLTEELQAALQ